MLGLVLRGGSPQSQMCAAGQAPTNIAGSWIHDYRVLDDKSLPHIKIRVPQPTLTPLKANGHCCRT